MNTGGLAVTTFVVRAFVASERYAQTSRQKELAHIRAHGPEPDARLGNSLGPTRNVWIALAGLSSGTLTRRARRWMLASTDAIGRLNAEEYTTCRGLRIATCLWMPTHT